MERIIILSNIGSASKKYSIYQGDTEIAWFHLERQGVEFISSYKVNTRFEKNTITQEQYERACIYVFELLQIAYPGLVKESVAGISLRVVVPHKDFIRDQLCTPKVLESLKSIKEMDPIHIEPVLFEIDLLQMYFGVDVPLYFISDSGFHTSSHRRIPLMFKEPLYTIGYHGLSCESVISLLNKEQKEYEKLIVVHLGGGSSVTAIKKGVSKYNSMEFSPLDGIVMSSRSGSIDPFAVMLYMKEHKLTCEQTLEDLYFKSGMYALSGGISNDLRVIREEAFKGNVDAKDAIIQFVDSIVSHICEAISYTQGADSIVFTGTIGYRATYIREMVIEKLLWLGCILDHTKNLDSGEECFEISAYNSKIKIYTVLINEMKEMHTHTQKLL